MDLDRHWIKLHYFWSLPLSRGVMAAAFCRKARGRFQPTTRLSNLILAPIPSGHLMCEGSKFLQMVVRSRGRRSVSVSVTVSSSAVRPTHRAALASAWRALGTRANPSAEKHRSLSLNYTKATQTNSSHIAEELTDINIRKTCESLFQVFLKKMCNNSQNVKTTILKCYHKFFPP